jgi:hypothetical protein
MIVGTRRDLLALRLLLALESPVANLVTWAAIILLLCAFLRC